MTINGRMLKMKTILVSDPVAHCQFHWMQPVTEVQMPHDMRVAFVTCGPQTLRYKELDLHKIVTDAMVDGTRTVGDTTTKVEHLAPVNIDGLTVLRVRVTTTQHGADGKGKEWSTETWYSPELRETVRQGSETEGYSGFIRIRQKDPDPKLFYPPDGYTIQLQTSH